MITCERCKTENLDGNQYCDECGAPLRPNARVDSAALPSGPNVLNADANGQNGSKSPVGAPHPEVAGKAAASRNLSSPARSTDKPHAKLVIERGKSVGKQFLLSAPESHIGRWDADGGIFPDVDLDSDDPDAKVSRRHASITMLEGKYFLEDLGSTNGTFINRGKRLPAGERQPLRDGDEVIVGKTFLRFQTMK